MDVNSLENIIKCILFYIAATIANFKNGQNVRIIFQPEWISEAEHLSLRFKVGALKSYSSNILIYYLKLFLKKKTEKKASSILLSTYSILTKDLMEISLENTQIRLFLKIGNAETVS